MSVHGKVTDFQMWDRVLADDTLAKVHLLILLLFYIMLQSSCSYS